MNERKILPQITSPHQLRRLDEDQLSRLADELRDEIVQVVSKRGGHLASNLGVAELTIALHYVFDFSRDRLTWDVGHQSYAHKILTGRAGMFPSLRQKDGLSGFPSPAESDYDLFATGHAGAAISTALGMAWADQHTKANTKVDGLRSRVNGIQGEHMVLEMPRPGDDSTSYEFTPAEKIGVNLKLKHYKHIFSVTVVGKLKGRLDDGTEYDVLVVCWPSRMQRLQRRAYLRADVPDNRIARASVWLGGQNDEPAGTSPDRPVWSGQVTNLSAGGFQMRTSECASAEMDLDDIVGVRLGFGAGQETVYADAQFRHAQPDGEMTLIGFQFVGLGHSAEGLKALKFIITKVSEYHQATQAAAGRRNR